jgi:glycosyltransferase involved in cell wall biosynthesis
MAKRIVQLISDQNTAAMNHRSVRLACGLDPDKFQIDLVVLGPVGSLPSINSKRITVHTIGKRGRFDPIAAFRLRRLIGRIQPELIHAWGTESGRYASLLARGKKRPWLCELQTAPGPGPIESIADRRLLRRANRIVVDTAAARDDAIQAGFAEEKIEHIPSGVASPANPNRSLRKELLEKIGIEEPCSLIGIADPAVYPIRHQDAIWAIDLIKVLRKDIHLLIFGSAYKDDTLIRFRNQVEIADQAHFIDESFDLKSFLPMLDLFWSTIGPEGQSNAILDAMAAGLPSIITDTPANRELITDQESGHLIPVGLRSGFSKTSQRLLKDPEKARQLGQAAKARIKADFTTERMVADYCRLYDRLS